MARIQILGQNGSYIELGENIEVPLNFSIADIKDIEKRKGAFSKTITVPGTKNNHDILKHYYNVNIENGDFINNIIKCALIGDSGEILFNNGVIQLLRVVKRNVVATGEDKVNYEILLKDDAGDFFANMSNKKLEDLFFQDLNHRYDLATVSASTFHTSVDGYKYILPHIEPQGLPTDNQYKLTELKPGIYAKRYLDSIFQSNGYTYTWSEINSSDIQFDNLIVPYNGDVPKLDEQDVQQFRVVSELSGVTQYFLGANDPGDARVALFFDPERIGRTQTILSDEIEDIQSLYTPATGIYAPNYDAQGPGGIDYSFEIDYDVIATNTHGVNVQLKPKNLVSVPVGTDIITMEVISTVKNNTQNINYDYYFDSFNLERDYTLVPGDNVLYSSTKNFTQVAPNINSFNQLINGLSLKVSHIFAGQTTKEGKWYIPAGAGTDVSIAYQIRVNSVKMTILPSVNNAASYGSIIIMNKFVPKNIQQKDFLRSLMMMFNLFIIPDENNPGNLIIKNKDTYYSEGIITDWTDYLAKELPQEITFLSDLNAKRLTLTYKQDSDVPNKGYFENTGEIYGQSEFVFDNEYTKGDEKKEIIFSPTPNGNTSFAANLPIITGAAPKTNIRILYDGGNLPCQEYTIIETGQIASGFTTYPYVGHFDKPVDSNYDLNFSTPDYLFYDNFNTITQNNLFNKFWRNTFAQINNSKVLTAYFILDDSIISKFRMNDKIYLKQYESYWVVNQIYDYIVGGKIPTKVELVQIQDLGVQPIVNSYKKPAQVEFPAPSKRFKYLNSAPNRSDINIYGFDNYVTNNSTEIEIIGSGNNVGGSNISIYGNNNIDYWDNTTVNVSNLIITNPNSVNNEVGGNIWSVGTFGTFSIKAINPSSTDALANYSLATGLDNFVTTTSLNSVALNGANNTIDSSFNSAIVGGNNSIIGGFSHNSAVLGSFASEITGSSRQSVIIGGEVNSINGALNSVVLGGQLIVATEDNTVYVPYLNVGSLSGTPATQLLAIDANGYVVAGGPATGVTATTWSQVLSNGNTSGPNDAIMDSGQVISSSNGGGQLALDYLGSASEVVLSTDTGALAESYLYLSQGTIQLESGNGSNISLGDAVVITSTAFDAVTIDTGIEGFNINTRYNNVSVGNAIFFKDNFSSAVTSANNLLPSILIGTRNSTVNSGITNSVAIGGSGLTATQNDTVYVPFLNIRDLSPTSGVTNLAVDANGNVVSGGALTATTATWSQVLSNGNASLGNNVNITNGDKIIADDGGTIIIEAADSGSGEISTIIQNPGLIGLGVDLDGTGTEFGAIRIEDSILTLGIEDVDYSNFIGIAKTNIETYSLDKNTNQDSSITQTADQIYTFADLDGTDSLTGNHIVRHNEIESYITVALNDKGTRIHQDSTTITNEAADSGTGEISTVTQTPQSISQLVDLDGTFTEFGSIVLQYNRLGFGVDDNTLNTINSVEMLPTLTTYNEYNEIKNKQNIVTTTNATVTNLTTYTPIGIAPVFTVEFDVYGFEPATGDAIGAKAFATFKIVGGTVIQVAGTTLDRKSNFPGAVTAIVDTDGTIVRFRVQGQAGRVINWRGGYVINN